MATVVKLESLAAEEPVEIMRLEGGMVTIGRDPDNGIVIDSDSVSRRHCSIFEVNGFWFFRDFDSTNGSWINGLKVNGKQIRLLRDGDLIILSNFPMRITEVSVGEGRDRGFPSLLVFSDNRFELEYPLSQKGDKFSIGGPEGTLLLNGADENLPILEVVFNMPRLELATQSSTVPVVVNGLNVGGITALNDRDEIDLDGLTIVVNDPASAQSTKEARMKAAMMNHQVARGLERGISAPMARPGTPAEPIGWDTESDRKKEIGRKFIFGTAVGGGAPGTDPNNVTSTMSFRTSGSPGGFEVSASNRFTRAALDAIVEEGRPGLSEGVLGVIGVVMFILIVGAIGYFVMMT